MTKDLLATATHIVVEAGVRYWEDATVNDVSDDDGNLTPGRSGDCWCPRIELATGRIEGWPEGTVAAVHYKVCDEGEYWLANAAGERIAKWGGHYVPNDFLCHGDEGFGDYIIFKVQGDGLISGYEQPEIDPDRWVVLEYAE
jgi:hypothetical protein